MNEESRQTSRQAGKQDKQRGEQLGRRQEESQKKMCVRVCWAKAATRIGFTCCLKAQTCALVLVAFLQEEACQGCSKRGETGAGTRRGQVLLGVAQLAGQRR